MRRPRFLPLRWPMLLLAATVGLTVHPLTAAHIRAKIVRIGYPGSGRNSSEAGMDLYRPGFWTPILVELNNDDGDLFEGILQARQMDRDGDQVIASLPVAIRGTKEVFIYVPAGSPNTQQPFALRVTGVEGGPVELFDDANNAVPEWKPASEPRPLPPTDHLLLDISRHPLNQLAQLALDTTLVRPMNVARCTAATLPDSVPGLQMVDIVVWDDADPTQFRDISQQQALLDWVQRGGTLVMGVSRNWELVSKSSFGPLLPARLTGTITTQPSVDLSEALLGSPMELDAPVTHVPIRRSDLASDAVPLIPSSPEAPDTMVYLSSRPCGRGRIMLLTATIQDLLHHGSPEHSRTFLRRILCVRSEISEDNQQNTFIRSSKDPYKIVEEATGFRSTSGLYFLAAFLFVVVYILIATAGSWSVLRRRGRVQYAWTAFALLAGVASATSLAAVQVIRGIGNRVEQICVVDAASGSNRALANCYFGLKTASHVSLDLSVPRDLAAPTETADIPGGLMPMPGPSDDLAISQYSAGARYLAGATVGQLWNVPIRATLKQFQGFWTGTLPGQLDASLTRRGSTYHLTLDSWIQNKLDVSLTDCYLLVTSRNVAGDLVEGARNTSRAGRYIQVYRIGTLPKGKRVVWREFLLERLREERKRRLAAGLDADEVDESNPEYIGIRFLSEEHGAWLKEGYNWQIDQFTTRENELKLESKSSLYSALMVMSTFAELRFEKTNPWADEMQRSRGFDLDKSEALTTRTALLFGFAGGHAGPSRLAVRPAGGTASQWETLDPSQASTLYRFVIPLGSR